MLKDLEDISDVPQWCVQRIKQPADRFKRSVGGIKSAISKTSRKRTVEVWTPEQKKMLEYVDKILERGTK